MNEEENLSENENYYTGTNEITFTLKVIRFYFKHLGSLFPRFSVYLFTKLFSTLKKRKIKEKHTNFLNTAQKKKLLINEHELQFYFWGNSDKKILIVHGWEGMSADFSEMVTSLVKAGFSIVSFDLPAHGNSSGKLTHLPMVISLLKKIIPEQGPFYAVVGHSLGAAASAFSMAELNGSVSLSKLVLMGLHPVPFEFFKQFQHVLGINDKLFAKCVKYVEEKLGRKVQGMSVYKVNSSISADKVLLIHDAKDQVANLKIIKQLNSEWKNSELFFGEHGGHYKHYKHPEVVEKVIEFMKD